ncbi:MAG TPA: hypothetical protein VG457_03760 [Planctomycetota bacterium]|jgi:hypothetical protein|nr:hypothetical protein [Planctomycetota bacterium]
MRVAALLTLMTALLGQSAAPPRNLLKRYEFEYPAQNLKLWLPPAYEPDARLARKYTRKPTVSDPEIVTLRLEYQSQKPPMNPAVPLESDLLKVDPTLVNLRFTATVGMWRGKPVASARYQGFVQGEIGVYGRMVWLPLEPGTVVLNLFSEPTWEPTMNQDWNIVLANIEGPISEFSLRERAPRRWLAAKILATLGGLVAFAGLVVILYRMSVTIGGAAVTVGLFLPVVPVGYAFLHLNDCWRGLMAFFVGGGLIGVSVLLEY